MRRGVVGADSPRPRGSSPACRSGRLPTGLRLADHADVGDVGSGVMFRVRYVVAVLVGLAVGVAAGWVSGRGFESADPGQRRGHTLAVLRRRQPHRRGHARMAIHLPCRRRKCPPFPVCSRCSSGSCGVCMTVRPGNNRSCAYEPRSGWRQQVAVRSPSRSPDYRSAWSVSPPSELAGPDLRRYRDPIVVASSHRTIRAYSTTTVRARTDSPHNT